MGIQGHLLPRCTLRFRSNIVVSKLGFTEFANRSISAENCNFTAKSGYCPNLSSVVGKQLSLLATQQFLLTVQVNISEYADVLVFCFV